MGRWYRRDFLETRIVCSGKTTLINMISQKLNASRKSPIDKGSYFDLYVEHCDYEMSFEQPMERRFL